MQPTGGDVAEPAAEDLEVGSPTTAAHGLEAVLVELEDHGVRSDEAQPPGVVGRHGDATPRQLRLDGARAGPGSRGDRGTTDQTLKTVPRSGYR